MQTKTNPQSKIEIKGDEGARVFQGYASTFGNVDSYGDTIEKGAYENTLKNRERPVALRWNHYGPIIGLWSEIYEDDVGLFVRGELTPDHSVANDAYASMKFGSVDGLSIGYRPVKAEPMDDGTNLLREIDLVEISVVENPADNFARVGDVKQMIEEFKSLKDFEAMLRDGAGFSSSQAKAFVSRLKAFALRDGEQEAHNAAEMAEARKTIDNLLSKIKEY